MAELVIDLENKRFAEIPVAEPRPESGAAAEERDRERREAARLRLRKRVHEPAGWAGEYLDRSDLLDLLTVLGLDDE